MSDGEDITPNISDVDSAGEDDQGCAVDLPHVPEPPQAVIPELYSKFLAEQQNSADDPPETPFKSKYSARKLLRELHGLLATELDLCFRALDVTSSGESTANHPTGDGTQRDDAAEAATEPAPSDAAEASEHAATPAEVAPPLPPDAAAVEPNVDAATADDGSGGAGGLVNLKMPRNILNMLLGHIHLQLGVNYCETEQNSEGERTLLKAYNFLAPYRKSSECILAFISTCNQFAYMLSNRMEHKTALPYLKEAEDVYNHYTVAGEGLTRTPRGVHELFLPSLKLDDGISDLHKAHTHTLYFLAQVYKELNETDLSAQYCTATLGRQLANDNLDPHDWALNCGTLSCYFLSQCRYPDALHCLASASCMLAKQATSGEDQESAAEELREKVARVSRLWLTYALNLLDDSRKEMELMAEMSEEDKTDYLKHQEDERLRLAKEEAALATAEGNEQESSGSAGAGVKVKSTRFPIEGIEAYTKGVPTDFATTFDQKHIELAKKVFTLEDHCTDHVELIQSHSRLFHRLAHFEKDSDRVCKMHRRRADMLIAAAEALNPQYYLYIVRQLKFEAAEALISLLDLKLESYEQMKQSGGGIDPKLVKKINMLIKQAKDQFEGFYESLRDQKGNMPEMLSEDVARPALLCKFHIARLYSKLITPSNESRIENLKLCLKLHTEIVEQCDKQTELAKSFQVELEVSKEMAILLPQQLTRLSKSKA